MAPSITFAAVLRLARNVFCAPAVTAARVARGPMTRRAADVRALKARRAAARELVTPGLMTLRAVWDESRLVDFACDFANTQAAVLLCGARVDLNGRRLLDVLAGHANRDRVFRMYQRVVARGRARPMVQRIKVGKTLDVVRQCAVPVPAGVAVTLINVSALRREHAICQEVAAREAMP
jgi:hypothetical protein